MVPPQNTWPSAITETYIGNSWTDFTFVPPTTLPSYYKCSDFLPKRRGIFFTPKFLLFLYLFFYTKIFAFFILIFLHQNFCFFYTYFFTPKFLFFYTKSLFFYTKFFVFFNQNSCFFTPIFVTPKFLLFLHQILKLRKIFFGKKMM